MLVPIFAEVLASTGLAKGDIGFWCSGSSDYLAGRAFSFVQAVDAIGAFPPVMESHVEMDGAWALYEAWVKVLTGEVDVALAYGFGKSSAGELRRGVGPPPEPDPGAPPSPAPGGIAPPPARPGSEAGAWGEKGIAAGTARRPGAAGPGPRRPRTALGLSGAVAVNPSGGVLCGNPMFAAGLARIGAAAREIMSGRADRALGHATSGPALQQNLVCVMEAR